MDNWRTCEICNSDQSWKNFGSVVPGPFACDNCKTYYIENCNDGLCKTGLCCLQHTCEKFCKTYYNTIPKTDGRSKKSKRKSKRKRKRKSKRKSKKILN